MPYDFYIVLSIDNFNHFFIFKVEIDKLKWMSDLPNIKPLKNGEGYTARFSFDGDLLPYDADIDWRAGLHHHGEEPGKSDIFIY